MPAQRLVAVSYPADDAMTRITSEVIDGEARLAFLPRLPEAEQAAAMAEAEALIGWNLGREFPGRALLGAPALRFIQLLSAGADGVDFTALPDTAAVAGNVGAYAAPMAEHAMAMALSLAKRLPQRHAALAEGRWEQQEPSLSLAGSVCGILGFGGIGTATAALMRAFGARIQAVNTSGATSEPVDFIGTLADLDRVLAAADVLVIAMPLTRGTRGLIGARELARMKPSAILINVARGAIVDEHALYEHLRAHPDFRAGIDAWWHEPTGGAPFRTEFPFLDLPNVLGSPHNSGVVPGTMVHAAGRAARNVLRYLRGEPVAGLMRRADYG